MGWYTSPYSQGVEIKSTTIMSRIDDHALFAHWANEYKIVNLGANKCLNIYGDNITSLTNDINVTLWSDSGSNEQKWYFSGYNKDQQFIRSVINKNYGLNVYKSGDPYNCNIHSIIGNELDAELDIIPAGDGYRIVLTNIDSNTGDLLFLTAESNADGANVYWDEYSESDYQVWKFTLVS